MALGLVCGDLPVLLLVELSNGDFSVFGALKNMYYNILVVIKDFMANKHSTDHIVLEINLKVYISQRISLMKYMLV